MARANLYVNDEIKEKFVSLQNNYSIRGLKIIIQDESLQLDCMLSSTGNIEDDFNNLANNLTLTNASLVLFRINDSMNLASNNWILIAWVPDSCKVRDKMLYSSSREDLKRTLGAGYFKSEYAASKLDDLQYDQFENFLNKDDEKVFSTRELLLQAEKALTQGESSTSKSAAMGLLPLAVPNETVSAFQDFSNKSANFLEVSIVNESIQVLSTQNITSYDNISSFINSDEPRFYFINFSDVVYFIYSCPENSAIKKKMTASSSKATVISIAQQHGINITKNIEIRDNDDLLSHFDTNASVDNNVDAGSTPLMHSKPQRPGRGKTRVAKFNADE